ncbi:hypothetical protein [Streptomyces sp. NPDC005865]|uniref:hypothetical protein n=1 Tax=Streptomyces sp. NPDC005865 TaxID=3155453 RepID=UPI00340DE3E0
MNESWGMVAAAVAAGVFSIVGVLLGVFVGRRQVSAQAQVEHRQWLRGQRMQAYVEFLRAWDVAMGALSDTREAWQEERDAAGRRGGEDGRGAEDGLTAWMQARVAERVDAVVAAASDAAERAVLVATPALEEQIGVALHSLMLLSSGLHLRARHRPAEPQWEAWNRGALEAVEARRVFFRLAKADLEFVPGPGVAPPVAQGDG